MFIHRLGFKNEEDLKSALEGRRIVSIDVDMEGSHSKQTSTLLLDNGRKITVTNGGFQWKFTESVITDVNVVFKQKDRECGVNCTVNEWYDREDGYESCGCDYGETRVIITCLGFTLMDGTDFVGGYYSKAIKLELV